MAMQTSSTGQIDRQTTCPFLLKLFYSSGGFHSLSDFPTHPRHPPPPHLQIYTWPSLTLRELSHLLVSALPSLLPTPAIGTRLAYRLIYPDTAATAPSSGVAAGRFLSKDLGSVVVAAEDSPHGSLPDEESKKYLTNGGVMAGKLEGEPEKTLQEARFVIGDFIDVCILPPGADGGVVGPPPVRGRGAVAAGGGDKGGRENGYYGGGANGYRGRGRGGFGAPEGRLGGGGLPSGEWRRGERLPPDGRGGFKGGRGRGW